MIPDQWYVVLRSRELKPGKLVTALRMGERMVFWRDQEGNPVCQVDRCPHRGAALSLGNLSENHIQCPFHGFEFDPDGRCVLVPANGVSVGPPKALQVTTYPAREAHGQVYIWWGKEKKEYPALPWFDDLDDSFATSELVDHWHVHYSRAIENQLDVFHLPFVHGDSIGRGNATVSDGPLAVLRTDSMEIWVYNRKDDGRTAAQKAGSLPKPQRPPFLIFKFPNLWMNRISEDMRITVFFTPVDEENCLLYLRNYQRFVRVPLIRKLIAWMINPGSQYILNQDKRVVSTQQPKKSGLHIGEILIPADGPIILYRKIREKMQQNNY